LKAGFRLYTLLLACQKLVYGTNEIQQIRLKVR
jgi:hypothetical protein